MNKKFCLKCNQPTYYEAILPNICSNCGKSFASASMPKIEIEVKNEKMSNRPPKKIMAQKIEEDDYEEENENYEERESKACFNVPVIEIEPIQSGPKQTLDQLVLQSGPKEKVQKRKVPKINQKQFLKQWEQEMRGRNSKEIGGE